jgi:E3 ubiquitin-protein ligase NEDD4
MTSWVDPRRGGPGAAAARPNSDAAGEHLGPLPSDWETLLTSTQTQVVTAVPGQGPSIGFNTHSDELGSPPPNWDLRKDHLGRNYYVDHDTRTTTWDPPYFNPAANTTGPGVARRQSSAAPTPAPTAGSLPAGWEERQTSDGRVYYLHRKFRILAVSRSQTDVIM